jgi:hypothetical protein
VPTFDPDSNSFTYSLHGILYPPKTNAKMQRNLDSFFKPKKTSSPVPDHNPPLSQTQGSDSSLQNESHMDSTATTVTESTEYVSLSKTESVRKSKE